MSKLKKETNVVNDILLSLHTAGKPGILSTYSVILV